MTQDDLAAANRYIERAEECRVIASGMTDPRCKRSLMRVSDDYLQMAQCRRIIHASGETLQMTQSLSPQTLTQHFQGEND